MKPRRPVTKPRQAMSARQVERVEKEVRLILPRAAYLHAELTRLLASLRRSERR